MTHVKTRALVGFMGLIAASFLVSSVSTTTGCGSDDSTTGGAGTSGGGGTTGSGGSGGAGTAACTAPAAPLITDFGSGTALVNNTPYTGADTGLTAPTAVTSTGAMVITVNTGVPTTMYPYAYVGMSFNACTSGAAYTGVKFNISGTLTPAACTIQFSVVDKGHSTVANNGTCTGTSCYPSASVFTLPATATDVTVLFSAHMGGGADPGTPVINQAEILNIQWQFNVATGTTGGCTGTVTIDNITFM